MLSKYFSGQIMDKELKDQKQIREAFNYPLNYFIDQEW